MSFDDFDKMLADELDDGLDSEELEHDKKPVIILVIDDDRGVLEDLEFALHKNYRVRLCSSGEEGLAAVDGDVHAVILDIKMHGKDGFWTFQEIKKRFMHIPIIFHTAYQDIRDPYDVMNQFRPFGYISKGEDFRHLQTSIESAVKYYAQLLENRDLYIDLSKAHEQLLKLDEMKSKFISLATHELRTPLAVMNGYLDILQSFGDRIDPDEFQRMGGNFRQNIDKLTKIVGNIADLSRLTAPEMVLHKKPTSIAELIHDIEKEMQPFFQLRSQTITLDMPDDELIVKVERDLIWQVIVNLLLNAIRFTPDNGSIKVKALDLDDAVEVRISDTGIGIPVAEHNHIFKSFYEIGDIMRHSSGTIEFQSKGMGMGLSIAKIAVEQHGGTIRVESAPDKGSTFFFTLPK